ncbi:glycosyltransferase family 2 protein [Pseudomonas putida]|uniref:glycosyltransferase family 2 protein n=1 Tax=Pseudomonas putida TaxID=303 RepID=UPI0018A982BC|nr:glycosyltransferase family 2 protein [Pseudomonas putida]MBF8658616.1 glycosyltransferase family 2 protein [Pseudomonas putida]
MIVIPMVGKSSRFFKEGYSEPKYKLKIGDLTVFERSVLSFEQYFKTDKFLFLVRSDYSASEFVKEKLDKLGVINYSVIEFSHETDGQADTVYQGLKRSGAFVDDAEPLYIFNIDTFRPGFVKSERRADDGYLEVFLGEGTHWSFALPGNENSVLKTTEKDRISDLCSNGLYYFKNPMLFIEAFEHSVREGLKEKGEFYIAPLYNHLIRNGRSVSYELIPSEQIIFCGTPEEYKAVLSAETAA